MRNGRYTAADIIKLKIIEHDGEHRREARAVIAKYLSYFKQHSSRRYCVRSFGQQEIYIKKLKAAEPEEKYMLADVPPEFVAIAALVEKKAVGHGGRRTGAGRKRARTEEIKKTRSIRMTDAEYAKVREFLLELRKT